MSVPGPLGSDTSDLDDGSPSEEPAPRLELHELISEGRHTLTLSGEVDLASRPLLDDVLGSTCEQAELVVLDLKQVTFMDSSGLHGILAAKELCAEHGCELKILPGSSQVQRLFELTGMFDQISE